MVAVSVYHVFYIIFTARGKKLVLDMWFKKRDALDLIQIMKYYLGKVKTRPRFGRFSYIEKMEYWAVVWGTVVMGITGGLLWFENTFLPVISNSGMDLATAIHYYEAILASLAIVVWHFYFVIYNPDVYPMNKAWFTGYLTREEMELEHPLELEEIEKAEHESEIPKPEPVEEETILNKEEELVAEAEIVLVKAEAANVVEADLKIEESKEHGDELTDQGSKNPDDTNTVDSA